jgi:hypothetical protein
VNTAAAPLIKVTSDDSRVKFSGPTKNPGYVSDTVAFIRYGKLNGITIKTQMNNGAGAHTGISNDYFSASGGVLYGVNTQTALYVEIGAGMSTGTSFKFTLEITPANGSTSTVDFPVTMQ